MSERILVIDDDTRLSEMLVEYLGARGIQVHCRHDATTGMEALRGERYDALVLDIMLPDLDGFEVCRRIRSESDLPILMLTARGDDTDRIVGLEIGADDYLPKPFNPRELLARLRAILRRCRTAPSRRRPLLCFGRLEIDREAREVRLDGEPCSLTAYQFDLLTTLAERAGRCLSREQLMDHLKGEPFDSFDRSIDVHISRIRALIEDDSEGDVRIVIDEMDLSLEEFGRLLVTHAGWVMRLIFVPDDEIHVEHDIEVRDPGER